MTRTIEIVAYNPEWPQMYREEAAKIEAVLDAEIIAIHHVGSTSVPNLSAKPIIDILVVVRQIESVDDYNPQMEQLGYTPKGEYGIPQRRYFSRAIGTTHTHHLHIFPPAHPEIERHLAFRDYLIAHPHEAQAYEALKRQLAQHFRHDSTAYTEGKSEFIRGVDERARRWRQQGK